tara:strand:+ start:1337 stop:2206 length:870 start_codon:yes stop_codon:yes gene_type:complete
MSICSVTVTFNPDTPTLIKQLISLNKQVGNIIVVDNGSTNLSQIKEIITKYDVEFIALHENKGLSYAQNVGVAKARALSAQYVLLLDQDSVLNNGFVSSIFKVYTDSGVGILGPTFFDPATNNIYKGTNYFGPFIKTKPITSLTDVTYVIASGSFFSIEVFDKVGPMNEDLFVDYIDVDWSLRAKKLGYRVAMTNITSMSHTIGDSRINFLGRTISVHSPTRRYFLVRNSFYMLRQSYIPIGYKVRELSLNLVRALISLYISKNKKETFFMIRKGMKDGLMGVYGPMSK